MRDTYEMLAAAKRCNKRIIINSFLSQPVRAAFWQKQTQLLLYFHGLLKLGHHSLSCMPQAKAKLVADAVWSKLTGVFVNDVLHVQVRAVHHCLLRWRFPEALKHCVHFT